MNLPNHIWTAQQIAALFGYTKFWVYKQTQKRFGKAPNPDPLPRCEGVKELRFNTHDPRVREWIERRLGPIDWTSCDE